MPNNLNVDILNTLTTRFGGSFYLLDSDVFESNYRELSEAFSKYYKKFNIAYSYKTNYTPKLVRLVNRLGGYAEVVSSMEMEVALRSGVNSDRIIWNGPIKDGTRAKELLLAGGTVNIDSIYENDFIQCMAESYPDKVLNLGIRCNYDVGDGVISRFGFDVEGSEFEEILRVISSYRNLHLVSLQAHFAKRNPDFWIARAEGMLRIYDRVVNDYSLYPERLDIGGGIYGKMPDSLTSQLGIIDYTYDDYAIRSAKLFAEHFSGAETPPYLFIEPGTALAGNCMRFVCRVETIKTIRGKTFITVGGSQKNISMNGLNPPMQIVHAGEQRTTVNDADIVGYTCIEGDVLQKNYSGDIGIGDYLIFSNCGSYSLVMKPPFIFPNCPVLDISQGKLEVIKRAESVEDLFMTYSFSGEM